MTQTNGYQPYMFSKTADFGTVKSVQNKAGVNVSQFVKSFTLHYYKKQQTISQKYLALNTSYQNSIILVVRHDSRIVNSLEVQIDGISYSIIDISVDDTNYVSYDLVTVAKVKKAGVS